MADRLSQTTVPAPSSAAPDRVAGFRARAFVERRRLLEAVQESDRWPQRVLDDLIEFNRDTAFGKDHDFSSIRTLHDLQRSVPIQGYDAHAPYLERMAAGESNVLTADDPAVFFTSSGTTGGYKKVAVTPRFMRTTFFPFFFAAWAPLVEHFPEILENPAATLNLKHDPIAAPPTTASGRPHVGASQVDFGKVFGEPLSAEPGTSAPWATLPVEIAPGDHLRKSYVRLRLAAEHDVRCVIGINPAMVAALPHQLRQWWPRIVKEVRDGTICGEPVLAPNAQRALQLSQLEDWFGVIRPAHVWPRMRAIFCWSTGPAALYMSDLREEYGTQVRVFPAPIAASEGPTAVALDNHSRAGSLVVTAAVHEFVDAREDVRADTETIGAADLEAGRDYHVVYTHVGGLYRYHGGDVVRVVDRVHGAPRMEYAGRANRSDVVGERLRDAEVVRALAAALESAGLHVTNAACRVEESNDVNAAPAYRFALGTTQVWTQDEQLRLDDALDSALQRESNDYAEARRGGALRAASTAPVSAEVFFRDWQDQVASGIRPTQVKDRIFRQDPQAWQRLTGATSDRAQADPVQF